MKALQSGWRRLFVVLWGAWLLYLVTERWEELVSRYSSEREDAVLEVGGWGVVLPILVALAIRWVARGFSQTKEQ